MKVVIVLAIIVAIVAFGPLLTIWALNTLFPVLAINYGFFEWLAVIILGGFFRANVTVNK